MQRLILFVIAHLLLLRGASAFEHVVHISVDGLHAGELETLMNFRPDDFSNFQRFMREGVTTLNARTDPKNSSTLPNHTSMFTGRPVRLVADDSTRHHGYINNRTPATTDTLHNRGNPEVDYVASVFDIAHDHGLTTALYTGKPKFSIFQQSYNATADTSGGRADQFLDNGDQGTDKIDRYLFKSKDGSSVTLVDDFLSDMQANPYDFAFLHFLEPDAAGHSKGWRTEAWAESVVAVDQQLGRVFELVDSHEAMKDQTAIILTTDHGGTGFFHSINGHNLDIQQIPFMIWGSGIEPGDLYDRNEWTRGDPLETFPDFTVPIQPIRNGDAANLALALLDLPPIDGSSINHRQDLLFQLPKAAVFDGTNQVGQPGDGKNWSNPNNWTRDGKVDQRAFVADVITFESDSESIDLENQNQVAHSIHAKSDVSIGNGSLTVAAGSIKVDEGKVISVDADVFSKRTIIKSGAGTLNVNGTISEMFVQSGTLSGNVTIDGALQNIGVIAPGNGIGVIQINDLIDHRSAGVLEFEIAKADGQLLFDHIISNNRLFMRGKLSIIPTESYDDPVQPGTFDRFPMIQGTGIVTRLQDLEYDGDAIAFEFQQNELFKRHHAGAGLFRILEHTNKVVSVINYRAMPGDANGDGAFNSEDLVAVFAAGKFENGDNNDATWVDGDWNGDFDFGTGDLVTAFQFGAYEQRSIFDTDQLHSVPEPNSISLLIVAIVGWYFRFSRKRCRVMI